MDGGETIRTKMCVIYKITSPSNKIYIGQSWDWYRRVNEYNSIHCKGQKKLYSSFKKYGFEAHKIEILLELPERISQESLNFYEIHWWNFYKSLGFNMLNIKEPGSNGKHSKETIQKMKLKAKGRYKGDKNPMFGKFGENHPAFGNDGYFKNWKEKGLVHPMLGRTGEKAVCYGRVGNKHPMFGKTKSNSPFAKKVINKLTGEVYLSAKDAAEILKLKYSLLTQSLRNSSKNRRKLKHLEYLD